VARRIRSVRGLTEPSPATADTARNVVRRTGVTVMVAVPATAPTDRVRPFTSYRKRAGTVAPPGLRVKVTGVSTTYRVACVVTTGASIDVAAANAVAGTAAARSTIAASQRNRRDTFIGAPGGRHETAKPGHRTRVRPVALPPCRPTGRPWSATLRCSTSELSAPDGRAYGGGVT
jgi:hypothetical protein